jgi:AsmA protein
MEKQKKTFILKILKVTGITILVLLLLMFLLPILFPGKIEQEVKQFANKKLEGKLNFTEARLSFFNHFPSLTLTLTDLSLTGSAPYKNENLIKANEIAFGINLKSLLFDNKVTIDEIYLSNGDINVKVNEKGEANYNVYKSDSQEKPSDTASSTALRLDRIAIENCKLNYNDKSTKILIKANGFNYIGNGDLDKAIFDLYTEATIDSLDFTYNGATYLKNKKVNADLITKINTNSLAFVFQQNNLKINKLPVEFKGKFDFLSNGYDMDFNIKSEDSKLNDFFTALPPDYVKWLDKAKVKGSTDLKFILKGKYIASQNKKPTAVFNMKIREGAVNYNKSAYEATNIFLNFDTKLPSLDVEKLEVNIDSVFFNINKDYCKAIIKTQGLSKPKVDALIDAKIDLAQVDKAFGLQNMDLRGVLTSRILAKGFYDKKQNKIPVIDAKISLKNGYIKTNYYPNPITAINVVANVKDKSGTLKDLKILIQPAQFNFEGKPIYVKANLENFDNITYDVKAKGELDLEKIYKVFSQKGLTLKGYIKADVAFKGSQEDATKGNYSKLQNSGTLQLKNIATSSEFLPKPFVIKEGLFTFNQDKMAFDSFKAVYGKSDFLMNGYLQNVIDFVLTDKAILKGNFSFSSNFINVDEFMSIQDEVSASKNDQNQNASTTNSASGVIVIPKNFDLQLMADAKKILFDSLEMNDLKGSLTINKGKVELKKASVHIIGCNVQTDAFYNDDSINKAFFGLTLKANDFDVKRAYNEVKLFREMVTAAESAEGIISLDYSISGVLNNEMMPVFPSLSGGGILSVKDVKMKGFKLFSAVSRKTGKDKIKNPNITKVDIKTTIKNNLINIERFKFRVAGFRPRIEGQTSFDGKLNIKMRLGLPPLGIIGIPIKVTGTQENPKVRLGKKTEDLQETEYDGEAPKPME